MFALAHSSRGRRLDKRRQVRAFGFDARSIRWEDYLALSEAGFATRLSKDHQIVFDRKRGIA